MRQKAATGANIKRALPPCSSASSSRPYDKPFGGVSLSASGLP